jgi:predicted RNA binding protein YcfA (HicA-like mRNA interferase family)
MPKGSELIRFLLRHGYKKIRQRISLDPGASRARHLVVPVHRGDLPKALFLKILKDAGFSMDDFRQG